MQSAIWPAVERGRHYAFAAVWAAVLATGVSLSEPLPSVDIAPYLSFAPVGTASAASLQPTMFLALNAEPEALTFETGSNRWTSFEAWPPRANVTQRSLYFHANGRLSYDAPSTAQPQFDSYVSDPAHPVPYRPRPVEPTYNPADQGGSRWSTWLLEDQRFVENRPDVLTWETEPLTQDTAIAGDIVAHLFASTSGTDSDWVVKLIDVYPESYPKDPKMGGYELMIADEILRGRFRRSFAKPEPIPANQVIEYAIDLHTNDHAFLKDHRIMVQVQSTWFPLYDRNPQKFVPNIFLARESDYLPTTQRIFRSSRYPSHVTIPVLTR